MSEYFELISKLDTIQSKIWNNYSEKYEDIPHKSILIQLNQIIYYYLYYNTNKYPNFVRYQYEIIFYQILILKKLIQIVTIIFCQRCYRFQINNKFCQR